MCSFIFAALMLITERKCPKFYNMGYSELRKLNVIEYYLCSIIHANFYK